MTNAARHSRAGNVEVAFRVAGRALEVDVVDDGSGFAPAAGEAHEGRGLSNMETRARALGARLDVRSGPGRGTTIHLGGVALPHRPPA